MRWSLKNLDKETVEQAEVSFQGFSLEKLDRLILDIAGRYGQLKAAAVGIAALVSRGMEGKRMLLKWFVSRKQKFLRKSCLFCFSIKEIWIVIFLMLKENCM